MRGRRADWLILAAGVTAAVSWAWHGMIGLGMAAMLMLGMALVLSACMAITRPGLVVAEGCSLLLALLLVAAPWALGFTGDAPAAMTSWTVGAVAALAALLCLPLSYREYRRITAYGAR